VYMYYIYINDGIFLVDKAFLFGVTILFIELNRRLHSDDDITTVFIASYKGFKLSILKLFLVSINTRNSLTYQNKSSKFALLCDFF